MINDFISRLPGFKHDLIYDLIAYQDLRLCLDVGAAAGLITQQIAEAGSKKTTIVAFEPFPGNHQFFLEKTHSFKSIQLVKKAVSNQAGVSTFHVPSIVIEGKKAYENMHGYSSVGFLIQGNESDTRQKLNDTSDATEFSVETVALDDIIDRHVDFMKMDIQGGEFHALQGCQKLIQNHGIDVMYIEFDGEKRVLELLSSYGYSIFDTDYLIRPVHGDHTRVEAIGFYDLKNVDLSTGHSAYHAKLRLVDQDYCQFFKEFRQQHGSIYTDLICVSNDFLPQFLSNLDKFVRDRTYGKSSSLLFQPLQLKSQTIQNSQGQNSGTLKLASDLFRRIINYYSRWPIALATAAIIFNAVALIDVPSRWVFITGGTLMLLFLIGHSASKADYVLVEVEKLRAELSRMAQKDKLTAQKKKGRKSMS
jgi:FkbM family methyltransferase